MSEEILKKVLAGHPDMICPDHKKMLLFCVECPPLVRLFEMYKEIEKLRKEISEAYEHSQE